jgi:TfoX/Sxy family transcriptional regulator of competence genes
MPYNELLDERIKKAVARWKGTDAKKMFGGVCHLLHGNMFGGVYKDYLIVRLGEEQADTALKKSHTRPFDITGKPMKGWVMVDQKGIRTDDDLKKWLTLAKDFVKTLPPK